jgi:hypothetical protein
MSDISPVVPGFPGNHNGYGAVNPGARNGVHAVNHANGTPRAGSLIEPATTTPSRLTSDSVEVSNFARLLDLARRLPEVRLDKVTQARQAIADGTYDNEDVLDHTISRMVEEEQL